MTANDFIGTIVGDRSLSALETGSHPDSVVVVAVQA